MIEDLATEGRQQFQEKLRKKKIIALKYLKIYCFDLTNIFTLNYTKIKYIFIFHARLSSDQDFKYNVYLYIV